MKKKNLLMMALSLCLVAVVAVGGTLAYLSDSAESVTNTFTFGEIEVTLSENEPKNLGNASASTNINGGYDYVNVVPGQKLDKEPTISVNTSVDAYVFARVNVGDNLALGEITLGWTKVSGTDNVWYQAVSGDDDAQSLGTLFNYVTVDNVKVNGDSATPAPTLGTVKIEVAAVQQASFDDVQAAYNAANTDGVFQS